ncbi:hypothetical protein Ae201684P_010137 [Aphanomyces euteiches]|nr:hypothetical protein Ae201684P_010137 [Aphanomyces euteiches]
MSICQDLKSNYGVDVAVRTMRRVLVGMGFKHQKGRTRIYLAETHANVTLRAKYLRKKITNRCENGCPIQPEVYLDGSYCNLNHSPRKTWVDRNEIAKNEERQRATSLYCRCWNTKRNSKWQNGGAFC